jgi:hypothetical protein
MYIAGLRVGSLSILSPLSTTELAKYEAFSNRNAIAAMTKMRHRIA